MPWKIEDVDSHIKGLDDKQKAQWVAVANAALAKCEKEGGDKCDASAIKQANAAVSQVTKAAELLTVDIPGVEILATGKWKGHPKEIEITGEMLDGIIAAFDEMSKGTNYEPPVKLGHDDTQALLQADGFPAAGWVKAVRRVGDKLMADFARVPSKIGDVIKAGGYKKVSSEVQPNYESQGKVHPWVLKAVSLLGADIPAVKSISDIVAQYTAGDSPVIVFYEANESLDAKMRAISDAYNAAVRPVDYPQPSMPTSGWLKEMFDDHVIIDKGGKLFSVPYSEKDGQIAFDFAKAVEVIQAYQPVAKSEGNLTEQEAIVEKELRELLALDEKADVLAAVKDLKAKADTATQLSEQEAKVESRLKETEDKVKVLETSLAESNQKIALKERDERVSTAMRDGKLTPAMRDRWGNDLALKDPARFSEIIASLPKVIDLTEHGVPGGGQQEVQLTEAELTIAAKLGLTPEDLIKSKQSQKK